MKKFTVHLDIPADERNDFIVYVEANTVREAVEVAVAHECEQQEYDYKNDVYPEILEVFEGHVKCLWDRPHQRPKKGIK